MTKNGFKTTQRFVITGVDRRGTRFAPIHTSFPRCFNIWRGTVWELNEDGSRTKSYSIYN